LADISDLLQGRHDPAADEEAEATAAEKIKSGTADYKMELRH
jgi:hypothetical protein